MWKPIYSPGPWKAFQDRKDIKHLPLMEARKKYMEEQLMFENYVSSLQTLNTVNSLSPSVGAGGGPKPTPKPVPPPPPPPVDGDLCKNGVTGDDDFTLVKVDGGDEYISNTYYMDMEGFSEWFEDRENALVLIWNGSNWNNYYYSDAAAGIWEEGTTYTNYLGQTYDSNGPEYELIGGGTNPNSPIGTQLGGGGNVDFQVLANPCVAGAGKELEYDQYHIISRAYMPSSYPELVPDYISPLGVFKEGYPSLFQTGSDFFASESLEPYYRSRVKYYNGFGGNEYRSYIDVYSGISSSFYSELTQPLKTSGGNVVGDYFPVAGGVTPKATIEQGPIPNVISYSDTYNGGKGTVTAYLNYIGKDSSGVAEYGYEEGEVLAWNGTAWEYSGVVGDSTNINDASGLYDVSGTIHTIATNQTNANG